MSARGSKVAAAALFAVVISHAGVASGQTSSAGQATKPEWTLYSGQGVDASLLGLPRQILRNDIRFEPTYFLAVGYGMPVGMPSWMTRSADAVGVDQPTAMVEVIGVKHRGLQTNFEADVAYMLRTGFAHLGPVRLRAGAGIGLSYAFGRPTYEDGSAADPSRRYRFQNYNAIELEAGLSQLPDTSLVTRVHHRSGLYGLIAPRRVGSNFLTIAVRHRF